MSASFFDDALFVHFAKERPFATATQMTLRRMLDAKIVDQLFTDYADQQYHRTLLFSNLAVLVSGIVLGKHASINAGYGKMKDELGVSVTAVYEKLQRVELPVVQQLVRHTYQQAKEICKAVGCVAPNDLPGYSTRILDGNWLGGTEHRLAETRATTSSPLPGKSLVVYDPRFAAVTDFFPMEDGYSQERSGLDEVIETLTAKQLWLADRNFCTLKLMYAISAKSGVFVIRLHNQLHGTEKGKLRKVGTSETGVIYENKLVLPEHDGKQLTLRRVVVHLYEPTRDKDVEVVLLTNLPRDAADGVKVSELYRTRWKIEKAFGHLATALNCEIKPLCYPRAALFCFGSALMAYNAFAVIKGAIAAELGRNEAEMLSHYYMALEIKEATDGMLVALREEFWAHMEKATIDEFATELRSIFASLDMSRYRKHIRGPKKPKPKRTRKNGSTHCSTKRILDKRKEKAY